MDKETKLLAKMAIIIVVALGIFIFVAGATAGAGYLLTRYESSSDSRLADLDRPDSSKLPDAKIFAANSDLTPASMVVIQDGEEQNRFSLSGKLDEINEETVVVAGQKVLLASANLDQESIQIGSYVVVQGIVDADDRLVAEAIFPYKLQETNLSCGFTGEVESLDGQQLTVEGKMITLVEATVMPEEIRVGDRVVVKCFSSADGELIATEVKLLEDQATRQFYFQGKVDSIDPWIVGGIEISLDDGLEIDRAIEVGSLVSVSGLILEDGTWEAQQINLVVVEQKEIMVVFIGKVESIDPWIVNGISLTIADNVLIEEDISVGTLVSVEALLRSDGTYVIRSISRVDQRTQEGCFNVKDVVIQVEGNRLRLQKWPELILAEDVKIEGELLPGRLVLVRVCVLQDQTLVVRSVTVIDDQMQDDMQGENKVTICHIPPGNPDNRHTITVGEPAVEAHVRNHGDTLGPCP